MVDTDIQLNTVKLRIRRDKEVTYLILHIISKRKFFISKFKTKIKY